MPAKDIVGTPHGVSLDGQGFKTPADADFGEKHSNIETEAIATSGNQFFKMTKVSPDRESVNLIVNADELVVLKALAQRIDPFPMSYENASGDIYVATDGGKINMDTRSNATGIVTVKLMPVNDWEPFIP